jgi:hypothetical protein
VQLLRCQRRHRVSITKWTTCNVEYSGISARTGGASVRPSLYPLLVDDCVSTRTSSEILAEMVSKLGEASAAYERSRGSVPPQLRLAQSLTRLLRIRSLRRSRFVVGVPRGRRAAPRRSSARVVRARRRRVRSGSRGSPPREADPHPFPNADAPAVLAACHDRAGSATRCSAAFEERPIG